MKNDTKASERNKGLPIFVVLLLASLALLALPAQAQAQDTAPVKDDEKTLTCPEYEGITCAGYVTDTTGALKNIDSLNATAAKLVARFGHEIAVVLTDNAPGGSEGLAVGIGETWVVKDATGHSGGIVVVIDRAQRDLSIQSGPKLTGLVPEADSLSSVAGPSFAADDFDSGVLAILTSLEAYLSQAETAAQNTGGKAQTQTEGTIEHIPTQTPVQDDPPLGGYVPLILVSGVALIIGRGIGKDRRTKKKLAQQRIVRERTQRVDDVLERLETTALDLPDLRQYHVPEPDMYGQAALAETLAALEAVSKKEKNQDQELLRKLWSRDLLDVIDGHRLHEDTKISLEMRATDDHELLDVAVQDSAREALAVELEEDELFEVRLGDLAGLVDSVRPYRVAEKRKIFGVTIGDRIVETTFGGAVVSDRGERLLKAGPVLEVEDLDAALTQLDAAYLEAQDKVSKLSVIHSSLPQSAARPAVAAALTDLVEDPTQAVDAYERVRQELAKHSSLLERDRLDIDAIAALLLLNHSEQSIQEFTRLYQRHRSGGMDPAMAVEYALAGLSDRREIERVRKYSQGEGIPVAIVAALMRNRRDGISVYKQLSQDLIKHGITGDSRRTIAGILAASLEPAQAERRWIQARKALAKLGLVGTYADVAAAFGASDKRGPDKFALAYAAQRQALSRSDIDDADRFAPELAHTGTSRQRDTWTGQPLPGALVDFDPFTFFYLHWVTTAHHSGQVGWEPIFTDASWSNDQDSWFGGGFGSGSGGFSGSSSGWGGSSWSSGSFGGFGGGFSSGGGGFSGGSSSW